MWMLYSAIPAVTLEHLSDLFFQTYHPTCYEDVKKSLAEPTSPATASPELAPSNPLSVLMSALSSPTSTQGKYSQTRLIRTLSIRHFRLIHRGNLNTLKALPLTPMLNYPLNSSPRLVHCKISAYFSDELSASNCNVMFSLVQGSKWY